MKKLKKKVKKVLKKTKKKAKKKVNSTKKKVSKKITKATKKAAKSAGKKISSKVSSALAGKITEKVNEFLDAPVLDQAKVGAKVSSVIANTKDKFDNPKEKNHIKVWRKNRNNISEWPEDKVLKKLNKPSTGVVFSGGGIRAATAALGQMRAFDDMRKTSKIKYLGCNSGGSWFAIPWTYLPKSRKFSDKKYLSSYTKPEDLSTADLKNMFPSKSQKAPVTNCAQALWHMEFANLKTIFKMLTADDKVLNSEQDETWADILAKQLLEPFGMYYEKKNRYATFSSQIRDETLKRNPHLKKKDFQEISRDRPFLLVSATGVNWNFLAKLNLTKNLDILRQIKKLANLFGDKEYPFYPYEFTPFYSGINKTYNKKETSGVFKFGGGYVENIGFDSRKPKGTNKKGVLLTKQREHYNRLSIQDMMATSGAAPGFHFLFLRSAIRHLHYSTYIADIFSKGQTLKQTKHIRSVTKLIKNFASIFPRYEYWSLTSKGTSRSKTVDFGDGGFLDNYGLISLLKRDVKTIMVFINSETPVEFSEEYKEKHQHSPSDAFVLNTTSDKKKKVYMKKRDALHVDSLLPCLFGLSHIKSSQEWSFTENMGDKMQVFNPADFDRTINGIIQNNKNKGLAYYFGEYRIKANSYWGVPKKEKVNICFVSLQKSERWETQLNSWKRKLKSEDMKGFPNYATFGVSGRNKDELAFKEQVKRTINLQEMSPERIYTLSNYTAWVVKEIFNEEDNLRNAFK